MEGQQETRGTKPVAVGIEGNPMFGYGQWRLTLDSTTCGSGWDSRVFCGCAGFGLWRLGTACIALPALG